MNNKNPTKRKSISLETKKKILDGLAEGKGPTALGREFGLGESTIRSIRKRAGTINKTRLSATAESEKKSSYSRDPIKEKMEKALVIWIGELTKKQIPVDGVLIREKAKIFYNNIKDNEPSTSSQASDEPKFLASNGWLSGFLKRHSFHNLRLKGEAASADENAAKNYCEQFKNIIEEGGYVPEQVFNADETGLFWKRMPSRTYINQSEKVAKGFKTAKDRVTLLLCSNASGNKILKPLLINKSLHPRALKGKNVDELPVHLMANKKAWVTSNIFTSWFNDCFVPEVERYLNEVGLSFNVLLLVDNAPGHPNIEHPNVKIIFLPPNTTSLIQPLDQGIIATIKKYYLKFTFRQILSTLEADKITLAEVWKKFSILDCITNTGKAVTQITQHTLNSCWKELWPECIISDNTSENSTPLLSSEIISLAHEIGADEFTENDILDMTQDEVISDNEVLDQVIQPARNEQQSESMTEKQLYEGLKIANKLEKYFTSVDPNPERAQKFQNDLRSCMSVYQSEYMKKLNFLPASQSLITDYMAPSTNVIESDDDISSDSDIGPPKRRRRM